VLSVIFADEYAALLVFAIATENVWPPSSSPLPVNVKPVAIPIGLPVTWFPNVVYVASAEPVTSIDPALAADIDAKEPHRADNPIFVYLFIVYVPSFKRLMLMLLFYLLY
jgi:hypothetical protein